MRIFMIVRTYPTLSETFVRNEVATLRAGGHAVRVGSWNRGEALDEDDLPVYVTAKQVRPGAVLACSVAALQSGLYGRPSLRAAQAVVLAAALLRDAKAFQPDVVHAHFATMPTEVAVILAAALGRPSTAVWHAKDYLLGMRNDALARRGRSLSHVFTISQEARREILSRTRMSPGKVTVVRASSPDPLGVNPTLAPLARQASRSHATLLCVARLVRKKGHAELLQALGHGKRVGLSVPRLTIIGDGPEASALRAQAADLGLAELVEFRGAVKHDVVLEQIAQHDCAVLLARQTSDGDRDGIPVFLMEAAALGKPIVTTAVGGIPELVQDGVSGVLLDSCDADSVLAGIARAMRSPDLGTQARAAYSAEFTAVRQVERLVRTWTSLGAAG